MDSGDISRADMIRLIRSKGLRFRYPPQGYLKRTGLIICRYSYWTHADVRWKSGHSGPLLPCLSYGGCGE